jgi:hypothetical protein
MVVIGVLVTGGFFVARQESRIGIASENGADAFYLAERGINETLLGWDAPLKTMAIGDSVTVSDTVPDGFWTVRVRRTAERLYFIDATGVVTRGGALYSGASRRMGLVTRMFTVALTPPAALTTRGQVTMKGSASIDGNDATPPGWTGLCSGVDDKPGLVVDDTTQVSATGKGHLVGTPPMAEDTTIADSTFTSFGGLSWADLVALADKTLAGGSLSTTGPVVSGGTCQESVALNWGDPVNPAGACGDYFPIVYIGGHARIQSGGVGQGVLLVDGDLDLRGNFLYAGIIIVQGEFETQGTGNRVLGGVYASNSSLGDQSVTGGSVIGNSSCAITRAILLNSSLSRPVPLARGWVDLTAILE